MKKKLIETIRHHIENKMLLHIERVFEGQIDEIIGFPLLISDNVLLMSIVNDFYDEGFSILRLSDISDAYSKEDDAFYEKICLSENIGTEKPNILCDVTDIETVLKQLKNYEGFISVQTERQTEKCSFYLGKIVEVGLHDVSFIDIGTDGKWDDKAHSISFEEITQITFEDNYSRMYYKYVPRLF